MRIQERDQKYLALSATYLLLDHGRLHYMITMKSFLTIPESLSVSWGATTQKSMDI